MPRVQLFQRIDARCEAIIEQGLFPVSWRALNELILTIGRDPFTGCRR